jgi:hypothetical protein
MAIVGAMTLARRGGLLQQRREQLKRSESGD